MDKFYFGNGVEFSYGKTAFCKNLVYCTHCFPLGDMHVVPNLRGDQVKTEMSREYTRSNSGGPLNTPNTSTHNSGVLLLHTHNKKL